MCALTVAFSGDGLLTIDNGIDTSLSWLQLAAKIKPLQSTGSILTMPLIPPFSILSNPKTFKSPVDSRRWGSSSENYIYTRSMPLAQHNGIEINHTAYIKPPKHTQHVLYTSLHHDYHWISSTMILEQGQHGLQISLPKQCTAPSFHPKKTEVPGVCGMHCINRRGREEPTGWR